MSDYNGTDKQPKKFDSASKRAAYLVAGVFVLILAALGVYSFTHRNKGSLNTAPSAIQQDNSNNTPVLADTSAPASSGKTAAKLSYGDAIKAYPYRFQFSQCHGTPGTMAVKKGSIVMLDNRDPISHTFVADSQTFKIAGYDYALLRTSALTNINITCDGGGAAKLNVEK